MQVEVVELLQGAQGTVVSSSQARDELARGNLEAVASLLGRPYRLSCATEQAVLENDTLWQVLGT